MGIHRKYRAYPGIMLVLCCCCGGGKPQASEQIVQEEPILEESLEPADSDNQTGWQVSNSQHCTEILNIVEMPEWVDDPMLIEALDDGRIMVVGYSTSDSIAEFGSDLSSVHGFTIEGGQGTLTALRSRGNSLYALRILILTEFDSRTGANLGVPADYSRYSTHNFDYYSDMFLVVSPSSNEVFLNWVNSSGVLLQTVDDPLRMNGEGQPMVLIPTAVAMDTGRNGWVSSGLDGKICIYRMNGQLVNTLFADDVPQFMRRFDDKMFVCTGNSFVLYDTQGNRVTGGILPEYCVDGDFTADGKLVAITRRGRIILMNIPCLHNRQ